RDVFTAPTLAGLAARIEEARGAGSAPAVPPLGPAGRGATAPLSFAQERLWFLDQLEPGSPAYNIPAAVELRGRLEAGALAAAFSELVRRHEALRTRFDAVGGSPRQRVAAAEPLPLPLVDLSALPAGERRREAGRQAAGDAGRPFD